MTGPALSLCVCVCVYRPLAPGTYQVLVIKSGYQVADPATFTVPSTGSSGVKLDVQLKPLPSTATHTVGVTARHTW